MVALNRIFHPNHLLTVFLIVAGLLSFSQDTIYIDPSYQGNEQEDGSVRNPFNSWYDLHWNDTSYMNGKVFLQKCGTVFYAGDGFSVKEGRSILFSSYGRGEKPEIVASCKSHVFDFRNSVAITFSNFKICGDTGNKGVALPVSCVRFFGKNEKNGKNSIVVENCDFSNAIWGIRLMYGSGATVKNCRIHNTGDDGIFAESWGDLMIVDNRIFEVNQKWFYAGHTENEAPGDCIQLSKKCGDFIVRNNYLDRSGTGNKFCFIHTGNPAFGIIENNLFKSPDPEGEGGACLFLGAGDSVIIRGNTFSGELQGIYSHGKAFVCYNVFVDLPLGINSIDESAILFNNVFYSCKSSVKGNSVINNCIFYKSGVPSNATDSGYNCYWETTQSDENNSVFADPRFVDANRGDFHLDETSPCIDKGTDVGLKYDKDGNPVPEGAGVDIGAYEVK
jgi:hypothetical protein